MEIPKVNEKVEKPMPFIQGWQNDQLIQTHRKIIGRNLPLDPLFLLPWVHIQNRNKYIHYSDIDKEKEFKTNLRFKAGRSVSKLWLILSHTHLLSTYYQPGSAQEAEDTDGPGRFSVMGHITWGRGEKRQGVDSYWGTAMSLVFYIYYSEVLSHTVWVETGHTAPLIQSPPVFHSFFHLFLPACLSV